MKHHLLTDSPKEFYEVMRYLRSPLHAGNSPSELFSIANYGTKCVKEFCLNTKIIGIEKTAHIALEDVAVQEAFCRWFWTHTNPTPKGRETIKKNAKMIDTYCAFHGIY